VTLSNSISGTGSLNKPGANTLTLAGAVNLAGPSTISGGTLEMKPYAGLLDADLLKSLGN